jgi:hypothetical protein
VNWTPEVVCVPITYVDRAKASYAEQLGFHFDHDTLQGDDVRVVQLTPPGSGSSIVIGEGAVPDMAPGPLQGLQLIVSDIRAAHAEIVEPVWTALASDVQPRRGRPRAVQATRSTPSASSISAIPTAPAGRPADQCPGRLGQQEGVNERAVIRQRLRRPVAPAR